MQVSAIRYAICGVLAMWISTVPLSASAGEKVVFVSFGANYQKAEEQALVEPFAKEAGLELISDSGPSSTKIKAMVNANAVQWDVVEVTEADYLNLLRLHLLEPIDYSFFDKQTLDQLDASDRQEYGVAATAFAQGIAYRTDLGNTNHPKSWADFWDVNKFPGARALPAGTYSIPPWEAALLADGVNPDQLYPLDFERALKSLDKIKPSVKVWYGSTAEGIQALLSGEVSYAMLSYARVFQAKSEGEKVDFDYGQAFLFHDYFVVPKGAPDKNNAMKLLAYLSKAGPQAELMKKMPYGVPNKEALNLIDPSYATSLPNSPSNLQRVIKLQGDFYVQDAGNGRTWQEVAINHWNEWFGR